MTSADARLDTDVLTIVKRVSATRADLTLETDLVDLGFDSLRRLELIAELEDHFDVLIPLNDTPQIRTAGDVRDCLRDLLRRQAEPS